jgi:hypothetical protein
MEVIWVGGETKNFFKRDWTGGIRLNCFNKFDFTRKALGPGFRCTSQAAKNRVRTHKSGVIGAV